MKTELGRYLASKMPLAQAMGVEVVRASREEVALFAPLGPNVNHKGTIFGGSLHAVATLACWSLVHLNLHETGDDRYHIVIAHSETAFEAPVDRDFIAQCRLPEAAVWQRFITTLQARHRARVHLEADVTLDGKKCMAYRGAFAALENSASR